MSARFNQFREALPLGVNLLAVSKGHPASSIRSLARLGQVDFGESRLQEAMPKLQELNDLRSLRWHFIGRLQSNKVRGVVRSFAVIHSLHSYELVERTSRIAGEEKRKPQVMLQVKFREDPNKVGFNPEVLRSYLPEILTFPHLDVVGLMTMAPINLTPEEKRLVFGECRDLANQIGLEECSMGMSSDWKEALNAGSTWLRLGSTLFGEKLK